MDYLRFAEQMLLSFFANTAAVLLARYVFCLLFFSEVMFSYKEFGKMLLCSLVIALSLIVLYSKKELSRNQMIVRRLIHFVLLCAILFYLAYLWNWVNFTESVQIAVFAEMIVASYALVSLFYYFKDRRTADKLNESLKKRYNR